MKRIDTINVIPFIDIMLVLLAIVLTTATFIARGVIPVDLPESTSIAPPAAAALKVTVTRDGRFFIDQREESLDQLARTLDDHPRDSAVVISVDRQAAFEAFFSVVDLLRLRGMENFSVEAVATAR